MNFDITPDWKESLLILACMIILILVYYLFNKKSIDAESVLKKKYKRELLLRQSGHKPEPNKTLTPQMIQAHERFMILLDRIEIQKLVARVPPISPVTKDYVDFLIQNIEQEFDFNTSQQLYVSEETWLMIQTAKQYVIQLILKTSLKPEIRNAEDLRQKLIQISDTQSVVSLAKNKLRTEMQLLA